MNKRILTAGIVSALYLLSGVAVAIPSLQLDIDGGVYNTVEESMVTASPTFDLYAYGNSNGTTGGGGNLTEAEMLATTYYLSIALTPVVDTASNLGSIDVNGMTYDATADFIYGTPPSTSTANPDLTHGGYFDTYYLELAFNFDQLQTAALLDVQTDGGSAPVAGTDLFYIPFAIDMTNLADGYNLHFDLYSLAYRNGDTIRGDFAPYSHDASTRVPEPTALILFSMGLLGIGAISRKKKPTQTT